MSDPKESLNSLSKIITPEMKFITNIEVPKIDITFMLKPILDSMNELNKQTARYLSESAKISLNSVTASFDIILKEFKEVNNILIKELNNSIYYSVSETLQNITKISNLNLEQSYEFDSSVLVDSLDTISELINEDDFLEHPDAELIENKNEIMSIKSSMKSNKATLVDYIVLICTIVSTIYTVMSYYKPNNDEEILKVLNQINSKMEQDLKITK